jgi:hypothetical protein
LVSLLSTSSLAPRVMAGPCLYSVLQPDLRVEVGLARLVV